MEVIVGALVLLGAIGTSAYIRIYLGGMKEEIEELRKEIRATRQAKMRSTTTDRQLPHIDSRGRTTRRDTDDLPRTGRMTSATSRKRTDGNGTDG